jgi:hypothetical protein
MAERKTRRINPRSKRRSRRRPVSPGMIRPPKKGKIVETFTLTIKLGNKAMQWRQDVAGALEDLAQDFRVFEDSKRVRGIIRDTNGNNVGSWEIDG